MDDIEETKNKRTDTVVECEICGKDYTKSNKVHHNVSKGHIIVENARQLIRETQKEADDNRLLYISERMKVINNEKTILRQQEAIILLKRQNEELTGKKKRPKNNKIKV